MFNSINRNKEKNKKIIKRFYSQIGNNTTRNLIENLISNFELKYNNIDFEVVDYHPDVWFLLGKNGLDYGSFGVQLKDKNVFVNLSKWKDDLLIEIKSEQDIKQADKILSEQIIGYDYFYDIKLNDTEYIHKVFNQTESKLQKEIQDKNIKIVSQQTACNCRMGEIFNSVNNKKLIYRLMFEPQGFIASIINENDEVEEFNLESNSNEFIKELIFLVSEKSFNK